MAQSLDIMKYTYKKRSTDIDPQHKHRNTTWEAI